MNANELAAIVVDICYKIHVQLGPGLFESVYEEILCYELMDRNVFFERQKTMSLVYKQIKLDVGFRADIIVENKLLIEVKSIEALSPVHFKQVRTYLHLSGIKLALLVNFNVNLIKDGMHRIVHRL